MCCLLAHSALKTIIGESCDAAGQATALGLVSLAWYVADEH